MRYIFITHYYQADGTIEEMVSVGNKIKKQQHQYSNIILDVENKMVVRCMVDRKQVDTTYDKLYEYMKENFPSILE